MTKTFKSVPEMARHIITDSKFHKQLDSEIKSKSISKVLFFVRCNANVTQKEMANRLRCTQSKISKIEHSSNGKQSINDLIAYAKALGLEINVTIGKPMKLVDRIKVNAFQVKSDLDQLVKIATDKKDDKLFSGVVKFFNEATFNINKLLADSAATLEKQKQPSKETLKVHAPVEIQKEEEKFEKEVHA